MSDSKNAPAAKRRKTDPNKLFLPRDSNQALGIANYALDFMAGKLGTGASKAVKERLELFHTDSVLCGISALAKLCNAPTVLREEALEYKREGGAFCFGSEDAIVSEKAIVANSSAVREWDSNGTVFGYNKEYGHTAGEFGHNDFYPVVIAACQEKGLGGDVAMRGMICSDEIRGRLAEVFSLKSYKIDHVVHGAIASAAVYGAIMGATAKQIEYAIGMVVAHYIPFRAIRAGHQLSDSKGASAAISTEVAILAMKRAMKGFVGPADVFRNPEAIFRLNEPTKGDSPFDIVLTHSGDDFALMGMHFKLGVYEHQSAGALQGLINVLLKNPEVVDCEIKSINVTAYEPAFGIIGDPAQRDPKTRQSADHSMVYILSRKLSKAMALGSSKLAKSSDALWKQIMLTPEDYNQKNLFDAAGRSLMEKIQFEHGGKEYDDKYPEGIPSRVVIHSTDGKSYDSGFIMFPSGHAGNTTCDLKGILQTKFDLYAKMSTADPAACLARLANLESKTPAEIKGIYSHPIVFATTHEY
jgi:2-methylcitrate dehydratase